MWKPPQRVKYKASPGGGWPSQQEASSAQLFKPLSFQALRLNERTWVPAMVPWRAEDDGAVTADNLDWYGRFARGQPGAIVVEATGIRDIPSGPLLRIGHDRYVPGLEQIVQRVREESKGYSKLFIQLIDFLSVKRRPAIEAYFGRFLKVRPEHAQAVGLDEAADEAEVRAHLMSLDGDELEAILTCRELAIASALRIWSLNTFEICRNSFPSSLQQRRCEPRKRGSMAWSCTTRMPTPWRRSCHERIPVTMDMAGL